MLVRQLVNFSTPDTCVVSRLVTRRIEYLTQRQMERIFESRWIRLYFGADEIEQKKRRVFVPKSQFSMISFVIFDYLYKIFFCMIDKIF